MDSDSDLAGLRHWQERVLEALLLVIVVVGGIAYFPGAILCVRDGLWSLAALDTIAYVCAVTLYRAKGMAYRTRAAITLTAIYSIGVCITYYLGHNDSGMLWLFAFTILSCILLGLRAAVFALVLSVGALVLTTLPEFTAATQTVHDRVVILIAGANYVLLTCAVALAIWTIVRGLQTSLREQSALAEDLEQEHNQLTSANARLRDAVHGRGKAERALRRLARAVEQSGELIMITDTDGKIVYANPAFERATGYPLATLLGHGVQALGDMRTQRDVIGVILRTLRRGRTWQGRISTRKRDGRSLELEATISPVRDAARELTNFVAAMRDVSQVEQLESRLRHAQKLEAIGTLAGGIAHDFNNILVPIMGYSELAIKEVDSDSPVYEQLLEITAAAQRARSLVQQILAVGRQMERPRHAVEVHLIVKEVLKFLRSVLPSTIRVAHRVDQHAGAVLADPGQIHQVVMNLCTNAYQAMEEKGGTLTVVLEVIQPSQSPCNLDVQLRQDQTYIHLRVSDTGPGIEQSIQEKVFDPFFSTKAPGKGTGLGLATVHGIVATLEGELSLRSRQGEGTSVSVYLPQHAASRTAESLTMQKAPQGRGQRILIVDDEKSVLDVESKVIRRLGYTPTSVSTSSEALTLFRASPLEYDLVITDQTMPGMTGVQLAGELKRERPDIHILLITGFGHTVRSEMLVEKGIEGLISKPFSEDELGRTVHTILTPTNSAQNS